MPTLPLMPTGADEVATPMPGGAPEQPMTPPGGGGMGGDLASLLAAGNDGGPMMGAFDPMQAGMRQFDMLAQLIADLARMFPGSEQSAQVMMEALDQWRQNVLVMMTPQPSAMPGADTMM